MQMVLEGNHPGPSSICFMPMIDQKSTDISCIATTLNFVLCKQASRFGKTPMITFDQHLYWKAMTIQSSVESEDPIKKCLIRIGDFHRSMSFLGAIGNLMDGSGLSSVIELIYAELTVPRIMNGKEVSRATRAHLIVYETLKGLILSTQLKIDKVEDTDCYPDSLKDFLEMINLSLAGKANLTDIKRLEPLKDIVEKSKSKFSFIPGSRTYRQSEVTS